MSRETCRRVVATIVAGLFMVSAVAIVRQSAWHRAHKYRGMGLLWRTQSPNDDRLWCGQPRAASRCGVQDSRTPLYALQL